MPNEKDTLGERGRALETDYFRRRDQELLDKAREQDALAERRRQLATTLGFEDPILDKLGQLGFDATTAPLLNLIPAIQVAWVDGSLPAGERAQIEKILARPEMKEAARLGTAIVTDWLTRQPGAELYRLGVEALRLRLASLDSDARTRLVNTILDDCNAVAGASGGVFGLGAHSSAESERIRELAASLGLKS
jgi:hypothetical protein